MPPQTFRGQVIVRKSSYVRYYAEHRRNLCYHVLKTPKRQYTLWFNTPDGERGAKAVLLHIETGMRPEA